MWRIEVQSPSGGTAVVPISLQAARLSDLMREELGDDGQVPEEAFNLPSDFDVESVSKVAELLELASQNSTFTIARVSDLPTLLSYNLSLSPLSRITPQPLPDDANLLQAGCPQWAFDFVNSLRRNEESTVDSSGTPCTDASPTDSTLDWPLLFSMLRLGQYVHADRLVQVLAARIACRIRGWTEEQQGAVFGVQPLTAEAEERLRLRESWAETEPELDGDLRRRAAAAAAATAAALRSPQTTGGGASV